MPSIGPQPIRDHPTTRGLARDRAAVLRRQLLRGQRRAKVGIPLTHKRQRQGTNRGGQPMIAGFAAMLGQQARDTVLLKTAQQTKYLPSPQPNQRTGITDAQPSGLHPGCVKTCDRSRRTLVESRHGVGGNVRMNRFVQCEERTQDTFLPSRLEDYVTDDNPVRVIDVFVAEFDLTKLGFEGMSPQATGRPDYHPSILLKIYLYGYLNRIQSSRRLERETQRNVEMMWLTGRLMPDFDPPMSLSPQRSASVGVSQADVHGSNRASGAGPRYRGPACSG